MRVRDVADVQVGPRRASGSSVTTKTPTSSRASSSCATAARPGRRSTASTAHRLHPEQPHAAAGHGHRPYYDRGELVKLTTHTVLENLVVGMALVSVVLFLFLGQARAAVITAINIPIALLVAFSGMVATGDAGQPDLARRDRLRDRRRLHRHHDGKHLPAPGQHGRGTITSASCAAAREVGDADGVSPDHRRRRSCRCSR